MSSHAQRPGPQLAAQVRRHLVEHAAEVLKTLLDVVQNRMSDLLDEAVPSRELQARRDAWMAFQVGRGAWFEGTVKAWQTALAPAPRRTATLDNDAFELLGTEVVENKIVASRLALNLMEKAAQEVNDLRKRLKLLNHDRDLETRDIVHPEALLLPLVEQWGDSGLTPEAWQLVADVVQKHLSAELPQAYAQCNAELIEHGVLPVIEFGGVVSQPVRAEAPAALESVAVPPVGPGAGPAQPAGAAYGAAPGAAAGGGWFGSLRGRYGRAQGLVEQVGRLIGGVISAPQGAAPSPMLQSAPQPAPQQAPLQPMAAGWAGPSAGLVAALAQPPQLQDAYFSQSMLAPLPASPVVLQRVAGELRAQSAELKHQAESDSEKAIIELVTLMFQAILQEDRIPAGIRVWFARLQMPVLRVALADPDFFGKMDHPARQLIDHMGSCVMGFDASGINSAALETEIKRIVQVIEQYPETGERVFRNVYDEFLAFLKQHLTEKPATQKVLGVAEQLERKETLAIQYTIELRNQIKDMPVRAEIRDFLFKVWAEVLAVAAVRQGPQHEDTLRLKKTASDLVWAASAKPNRADRARVIANLPELLQRLRTGMDLLGTSRAVQDGAIKAISDTLADAFMSKTQVIDDAQIQALAARLANLEDYVSDDVLEELPLDAQSIEDLLGIEASQLEVVAEGGAKADAEQLAAARELVLGSWLRLDYQGQLAQVQYVWRSPLGHLHLLASQLGRSYLFQTLRLAAYLQAGRLQPQEDEPLTLRATRDALGRLQAEPTRLLD